MYFFNNTHRTNNNMLPIWYDLAVQGSEGANGQRRWEHRIESATSGHKTQSNFDWKHTRWVEPKPEWDSQSWARPYGYRTDSIRVRGGLWRCRLRSDRISVTFSHQILVHDKWKDIRQGILVVHSSLVSLVMNICHGYVDGSLPFIDMPLPL